MKNQSQKTKLRPVAIILMTTNGSPDLHAVAAARVGQKEIWVEGQCHKTELSRGRRRHRPQLVDDQPPQPHFDGQAPQDPVDDQSPDPPVDGQNTVSDGDDFDFDFDFGWGSGPE
jgi:hypothetical protein